MPKNKFSPFHPIIYLRGFAGTQGEVEDTVADPYMGFNIGSTKARQTWDGSIKKFFFESPMIRLFKEHDYDDVYIEGLDQVLDAQATEPIPYKSLIIYRYYEAASADLGTGKLPEMEDYAKGLSALILRLRDKICSNPDNAVSKEDFRVYLVAHSMGGLVCRAFLQNKKLGDPAARKAVEKFFTYGTPHNGIDVHLIGNVPNWLSFHNTDDFNRDRMAEYLDIKAQYKKTEDASLLTGFDPNRAFNLVGTNAHDYAVAMGVSKLLAGEMSDGLVRIENATTHGIIDGKDVSSPRAFVNRSHSGHYGLVNSEEGYQNLSRFFFGDLRADGILDIAEITLPPKIREMLDKEDKEVRASYHFEVVVSVRGKQWQLHRRTRAECSAIFRKYDDLFGPKGKPKKSESPHLFSTFLDSSKRVNTARKSLGFAVDLRVLVPDYEVDGFLFLNDHFEGGYIYRDRILIEATPPADEKGTWSVRYGFERESPIATTTDAPVEADPETGGIRFEIPIEQPKPPGIKAKLGITARSWNTD
jgi:hypothetical protein